MSSTERLGNDNSPPSKKDNTAYGIRKGNIFIRPSFSETAPPIVRKHIYSSVNYSIPQRKLTGFPKTKSTENKGIKKPNKTINRFNTDGICRTKGGGRNLSGPSKSKKSKKSDESCIEYPSPKKPDNFSLQWDSMYEEVCKYQNLHGNLNFTNLESNTNLKNWWNEACCKFKLHKKGTSSFSNIRQYYRLRRIGIDSSQQYKKNDENTENMKDNHGKHGTGSPILEVNKLFPVILHALLSKPELSHIIGWMPCGQVWKIFQPKALEEEIMPKYFPRQKQFLSFMVCE